MDIYCEKCGTKNNTTAKFCKECGEPINNEPPQEEVKGNEKNKKIIFALIIVIVVILAIGAIYLSTNPQIGDNTLKVKEYDFGNFTMNVPEDASYSEYDSIGKGTRYWAIGYESDAPELFMVWIANYESTSKTYEHVETDGELEVYHVMSDMYTVERHIGGYYIDITGNADLKDLKDMARSISVTNPSAEETTSSTSSYAPASSTPSSISILGGSFSTGSADEDKTYARINVGTAHAGEDVIVQIFYSRDGNSLNNGNMVPATVHSDGYLEIASADAYKYYPDYATINIYDSNSNLLTTQSVSLSPSAGTQTF